jgi:cell division septation protein DedD
MSDDLFESFGSDDLFEEEAENQPEGEGQNKIFIIAVAAMGGLLVIALILFGVWAFVINPRMQANIQPTETIAVVEDTPTEDVDAVTEVGDAGDTGEAVVVTEEKPTDTPEPTATPVVGPTRTPTPEAEGTSEEGSEGGETTQTTPTSVPRRTPTPLPTRRPTATPRATQPPPAGSSTESLSQTGLGDVLLIVGALALIGVAFFARRLRSI